MTNGSINYSPDYKSEQPTKPLNVIFEQGMERQRVNAERARLERAVVQKAKALFAAYADESKRAGHRGTATSDLIMAVGELQKFEAAQK